MIKFLTLLLLVPALVLSLRDSDVSLTDLHDVIFQLENKPTDLDLKWMESIKKWYVPIWTKLYSYRTARDILQKEDLSEDELKNSCLVFNSDGSIEAFGKNLSFDVKPGPLSFEFTTPWKKLKARFSFKLTDSKTFLVGITGWQDGQLSWAALSTTPTMLDETKTKILNYVKTLGLDKSTIENNYTNCVFPQEGSGTNNEL